MDPEVKFTKHVDWISVKYGQMENKYNEVIKIYNEKIIPYIAGAKLLELIGLNPYFEKLTASLKKFYDLKDLSEDTIFNEYEAGIQITGSKKFINLTK